MSVNINTGCKLGLRGEFKCILWNPDGSKALETDWHSNLITNNGLLIYGGDNYTVTSWYSRCYIGSGTTPPAVTDTQLESQLGGQHNSNAGVGSTDYPRPPVPPDWERYSQMRYRFDAGNGTGNVNEIALGMRGPTDLFCRHVLPATIPKASNQALDVFYRIYIYCNSTPNTGQITLDGVTYDWETKPVDRDTYNYSLFNRQSLQSSISVWDDNASEGTDTSPPSGGSSAGGASYSLLGWGQGYEDWQYVMGLGQCVTATEEIRYMLLRCTTEHRFQVKFTAVNGPDIGGPLPKTSVDVLTLAFRLAWDRYTP